MVARNVADVLWHKTQQIEWLEGGGIRFSVQVDGLREITGWILGYGDQVKVLDPPELVRKIHNTFRNVLYLYRDGDNV